MSSKLYHQLHREEDNARCRKYHQEHKEQGNANSRKYHWEHRDELLLKMASYRPKYRLEHGEELNKKDKERYLINKDKKLARQQQYRQEQAVKISIQKVELNRNAKVEVLTHYGNGKLACIRCGYDKIDALTLDHINGDGSEQRKITGTGVNLYKWLKRRNYPIGYQTLCANCNILKRAENKEHMKREYRNNQINERVALINQGKKKMALTHYGDGKCSCVKCGFDDIRALSLDHINGDGHEHRDEGTGYNLYRHLIYNDYPIGLQTMCYNCQFVKRNGNNEHNNIKEPKYNAR